MSCLCNNFQLPRHILDGLKRYSSEQIGMVVSSIEAVYHALLAVQEQLEMSAEERGQLLEYMAKYNLQGLRLLPLANGKFSHANRDMTTKSEVGNFIG